MYAILFTTEKSYRGLPVVGEEAFYAGYLYEVKEIYTAVGVQTEAEGSSTNHQ